MFSGAAEAQTHCRRVVKLRPFSSCFECLDLLVSNKIVCPSESYFSRKVMSEVSVSRRRRNPSARSALPLTCTPSFLGSTFEVVEKHERHFGKKDFFSFFEENFDAEGVPPF
jgi:hypothetical protein